MYTSGNHIKWIYFWRVLFSTTVCYKKEGRRRRARDDGYERTDGRTDAALYYTCNTRSTTMATGWIKLGISKNFMIKSVRCSIFSMIVVFPFSWNLGLTCFWSFTQKSITNENINKQEVDQLSTNSSAVQRFKSWISCDKRLFWSSAYWRFNSVWIEIYFFPSQDLICIIGKLLVWSLRLH